MLRQPGAAFLFYGVYLERVRSSIPPGFFMRTLLSIWLIGILAFPAFHSCSTLEKASLHGLTSDQYKMVHEGKAQDVYVDVTDESIDIYPSTAKIPGKVPYRSVPLKGHDSLLAVPLQLKKQGLDIDITSILMKYRPSVQGLPSQLTTDINVALYAGWRFDSYKIPIVPILWENGAIRCRISDMISVFSWAPGPLRSRPPPPTMQPPMNTAG
jgi:hypothetical protein